MNDYVEAAIFIGLGCIGAAYHWSKKRYLDRTTNLDLVGYLLTDRRATYKALSALVVAEIGLSMAHSLDTGFMPTLSELVGALTAGYAADSRFNRAEDQITQEQ